MFEPIRNRITALGLGLFLAVGLAIAAPTLAQQGKPKPKAAVKTPAKSATVKTYTYGEITFQSALPLSAPVNYNDEAVSFFYPNGVKPDQDRLRFFIGKLDPLTVKDLGARGTLNKATTNTLMGLGNDPSGTKARTIFGQENNGEIHEVTYEPMRHVEAHIVTVPSGNTYYVAFEFQGKKYAGQMDAFADAICKTMKVK